GDRGGFVDREIQLLKGWPAQRIPPHGAEVAGAGNAVGRRFGGGDGGTGNGERADVHEVCRVVGGIDNRADHIRPIETVAAAAEVVLGPVELEGLAVLEVQHAVEAPAIFQALQTATHFREIVGEVPSEAAGDVEVRGSVFEIRTGAVVGLRCVGYEVFAVAGVIHGARPDEVHGRGNAVPGVHPKAGLEGVVVRFAAGVLLKDVEGTIGICAVISWHAEVLDGTGRGAGWGTAQTIGGVDLCLVGLADIEEPPEAMALRSDVTDLDHGFARELLLDVEVVVLHVWCLDFAVEGEDVALVAAAADIGGRKHRLLGRNDSTIHAARINWSRANVVISRTRVEVGREGKMAEHHVLREGIVEHAKARPDYGLPFSGDIPCEAGARGKIFLVWVVELAQARLTHLREGEGVADRIEIGDIAEKVALFLDHAVVVPTETIIQSQSRRQVEAVLGIETEVILKRPAG